MTDKQIAETPATYDEDGEDLTLIRWMLSLTVDERLQVLEDNAAFAQSLRDANPALKGKDRSEDDYPIEPILLCAPQPSRRDELLSDCGGMTPL